MTREECQKEIAYCYILNDRIRQRHQNTLSGFIATLITCTISIFVCVFMLLKFIEAKTYLAVGIEIGILGAMVLLIGASIFFIIDCKKELKKCDEMDLTLAAQEEKLKETPDTRINIEA